MLKNYIYFLFIIGLVVNIYSNKYTQGAESSVRPGISVEFRLFSIALIDLFYKLSIEKPSIYCKHTYYYYRPGCYYYLFSIFLCRFLQRSLRTKQRVWTYICWTSQSELKTSNSMECQASNILPNELWWFSDCLKTCCLSSPNEESSIRWAISPNKPALYVLVYIEL